MYKGGEVEEHSPTVGARLTADSIDRYLGHREGERRYKIESAVLYALLGETPETPTRSSKSMSAAMRDAKAKAMVTWLRQRNGTPRR